MKEQNKKTTKKTQNKKNDITEKKETTKKKTIKKSTPKKNTTKKTKVKEEIQEANKTKHNGIISFWKFIFCIVVMLFHGTGFTTNKSIMFCRKGSIGVEFFFIVSGYLLAKKALTIKDDPDNKPELGKETFNFILKKLKVFLPYTIVAGIIYLTIISIFTKVPTLDKLSSVFDMTLLNMSGIYSPFTNIATWYLSSMIICMIILYPLLRKYKYNFLYIVAPILVLLIYGYLSNNNIHLKSAKKWIGFTYIGNLRAFADLTLGCLIYPLVEKIKKIKFTKFGSLVITIIELVCFIGTICICHFVFKAVKFVYISILLLTIGITLAFSEKTLDYKIMCNKFNYWLEKLSLPVYIFHLCIREFIQYAPFMPKLSYKITILIYISSATIFGIIMMYIHDFFKKKKVGSKVLKLVIEK